MNTPEHYLFGGKQLQRNVFNCKIVHKVMLVVSCWFETVLNSFRHNFFPQTLTLKTRNTNCENRWNKKIILKYVKKCFWSNSDHFSVNEEIDIKSLWEKSDLIDAMTILYSPFILFLLSALKKWSSEVQAVINALAVPMSAQGVVSYPHI